MKARDPRLQVCVPARMHTGADWVGVTILNMSSRGLMIQTDGQLTRGSYVEVRRGTQMIIGRVVWARDGRLGLRSQDQIDVAAIVNEPRLSSRPGALPGKSAERRHAPRQIAAPTIAQRAERSRRFATAFQFISITVAGVGASVTLFVVVGQFLTGVSATIQTAMHGG
jgi:hypothetical protein